MKERWFDSVRGLFETITWLGASARKLHAKKMSRTLTVDMIMDNTGEEDLENVEEIEIIFGSINELANLDGCTNLRSLTCAWVHEAIELYS